MMGEYGRINEFGQVVEIRNPLPDNWPTPEGATVWGLDKLPDAVKAALGWLPVEREPFDPERHSESRPEAANGKIVFRSLPKALADLQAELNNRIDSAAGLARDKYCVYRLQDQEYTMVRQTALDWQTAGYPEPPPACILVSADARGNTPQIECGQILAKSEALYGVLTIVRDLRLHGKAAVLAAVDADSALAAASFAIARIEAV